MKNTEVKDFMCTLCVREGVSTKNGKQYRIPYLVVHAEEWGELELTLDTRNSRAGIILDIISKEVKHGRSS